MNIKIITKLAFPEIIKYNIIPIPLISKIGNLNNQCLKATLFHLIKFSFTLIYFFLVKNIKIKIPKWAPNKEVIDKLWYNPSFLYLEYSFLILHLIPLKIFSLISSKLLSLIIK